MNRLSLEPDEHMRWIYDPSHRDYYSDQAKDLRDRRAQVMANAPEWMIWEAQLNDAARREHGK